MTQTLNRRKGLVGQGEGQIRARKFCGNTLALALAGFFAASPSVYGQAERVLGVDISYWNCGTSSTGISQANWNTAYSTGNRKFAWIRATRGGTTGLDQPSGTPGGGSTSTLSRRYDDSRFIQNISRGAASGMLCGPYHFGRPDVAGNTGTDEADHFIQMAGPWMRPGYMMPVFDLEAGSELGGDTIAQFCIDFSERIYEKMQIRLGIYINGNYSGILQGATVTRKNQLAKPATVEPSVLGPAYPMLWDARYSDNSDPDSIPVQTGSPKTTYSTISSYYGPWDDYGNAQPWDFWQFASTTSVPGFKNVDGNIDSNVSHGDIEYLRNFLVPAVWWNDSSGNWSVLANWNSGQPVVAPVPGPGQANPYATSPLPISRLPGASGTIPNSGQFDTVILERPNANITVTLSGGSYNIRKFYMREALNITGGTLAINYDPTYRPDNSSSVLHGGPISAQFSGAVTMSGGSFSVHTLQIDSTRAFTFSGGILTANRINLMPHSSLPAKLALNGSVTINPLANATLVVAKGASSGISGTIDFGGGVRSLNVGNGASDIDFSAEVPLANGGFTKTGFGTMRLTMANGYSGGTTISAGRLLVNNASGSGTGSGSVTVNGGILSGTGIISGPVTVNSGGTISPGTTEALGTLTLNSAPTLNGTTLVRIDRNGGSPRADKLATSASLNYGGTLFVSNIGASLVGGETFNVFAGGSYAGEFANTTLPTLNAGLNWYLGDLTVNGSIKVNRGPSVNALAVTNNFPGVLQIPISSLLNGSDPDGDSLSLLGFSTSTNGVTLSSDGTFLVYSNTVNVADHFTFTVSDGHGGTATNMVSIAPAVFGQFKEEPSANGNSITLFFSGTPGVTYYVDRSTNLPPTWTAIWTNVAPENGQFDFTDTFGDLNTPPVSAFYRLRW